MGDPGLVGFGSVIWRINRENVLLLGGGRALILQVAHPLVAAGVAEHSGYREDPWGRLYRTLDLVTRIVFGDRATAEAASVRLRDVHRRIVGTTHESAGRFPAGSPYRASDPELLMWVHATLVDTSLLVYERYVRPLGADERDRYYAESMLLGEQYGIPRDLHPQGPREFEAYFREMLASDRIAVTAAMRDVVDATLRPDLPFVARPLVEAINLATVGLLPARLREELGLGWGVNRERLLAASGALVRGALPLLPGLVRELPPARGADRRVAA